jgi:hypothetical protein
MQRIIGLICLVLGGMLIYWGYNMSHTVGSQLNNMFNGSPGDKPILLYIGGAILVIAGLGQIAWNRKP